MSLIVGTVALAINFFLNLILSYTVGWGGGDYNSEFKNEPIFTFDNLEVMEHQQSANISHYMLNKTYLNGLVYRQIGFETRDNSICGITFHVRGSKEIYDFNKCVSTFKRIK